MAKKYKDNLDELDLLPYNKDYGKGGMGWSKGI